MVGRKSRENAKMLRALLDSYQRPVVLQVISTKARDKGFEMLCAQARIPLATLRTWIVLTGALGLGGALLGGVRMGVMFSIIGMIVVCLRVWRRALRNRSAVDRDLPALLTSVASSVRAGIDPLSALLAASDYLPKDTPIVHEVEKIRLGLAKGEDEEALLEDFLTVYASPEGDLFKRCLILSRRHGSSLADPLHRITRVVRQRQSFRRKVRAALAMHRMSAIGIALCAVAMGALQLGMNPRAFDLALAHPLGGALLVGGGALIVVGVIWMMMMGREATNR
jgi:tight adherence protein B